MSQKAPRESYVSSLARKQRPSLNQRLCPILTAIRAFGERSESLANPSAWRNYANRATTTVSLLSTARCTPQNNNDASINNTGVVVVVAGSLC